MTATPIVALDFSSLDDALRVVDQLGDACGFFKVGSELFSAAGPRAVQALKERGKQVFLDLKFHDIPNTVGAAAAVAARLGASLITVHASGGEDMLRAAVAGAGIGAPSGNKCGVLAVTVLTSLDSTELGTVWERPDLDVGTEVVRLSRLAAIASAHGVVCGGTEISAVRGVFGDSLSILTPGLRFDDGRANDQRRVVSPFEAARLGATYLVIGRPVTAAAEPRAAMRRVHDEIGRAL